MFFKLKPLPFDSDSLEPYISKETINFHYNKHHLGYLNNLNNFIEGNESLYRKSLEEIIKISYKEKLLKIFNNAAQVYNHTFYWNCMIKNGNQLKDGDLQIQITKDFQSHVNFLSIFKNEAITNFGSGWTWLIYNLKDKKLEIISTSNANTPITDENLIPILTIDIWEHAYYIDYRNKRMEYVNNFFDHLLNWNFAKENFANCFKV